VSYVREAHPFVSLHKTTCCIGLGAAGGATSASGCGMRVFGMALVLCVGIPTLEALWVAADANLQRCPSHIGGRVERLVVELRDLMFPLSPHRRRASL
jgi:hypothetical protein